MVTKLIYPVKLKLFAVNTACVIAFSSLPSVAQLADDSSGLETWLTKEQIQAFGLNALSVDQKQALSDWIGDKLAGATQQKEGAASQPRREETASEFEATVIGEVNGWNGRGIFKLDNGQVWVQRGNERSNNRMSNPRVSIKQNFLGFYVMTFHSTGQKVRVKRRQ
ncbi:hypothetical protein OA010_04135 [Luminiphilus sp.]|nr:hypothetical protein [Luminiphilus sp.]